LLWGSTVPGCHCHTCKSSPCPAGIHLAGMLSQVDYPHHTGNLSVQVHSPLQLLKCYYEMQLIVEYILIGLNMYTNDRLKATSLDYKYHSYIA